MTFQSQINQEIQDILFYGLVLKAVKSIDVEIKSADFVMTSVLVSIEAKIFINKVLSCYRPWINRTSLRVKITPELATEIEYLDAISFFESSSSLIVQAIYKTEFNQSNLELPFPFDQALQFAA